MKRKIFEWIRTVGFQFGLYIQVGRVTKKKDLENFLKKLHPVKIDKKLIRMGSLKDGGYIVPDDLKGIEALFSPGVGSKQDFDLECADKGMKCFMADFSVDGPVSNHYNFVFTKKFIGSLDNDEYMSIEKWIKGATLTPDSDLILQMDIEGHEYETIYSIPKEIMQRIRIIVIEFHQLELLLNQQMFEKFKNSFLKILETHYVVHIHPNNCCSPIQVDDISIPPVLEFSFIRKDRVSTQGFVSIFPSELDSDCASGKSLILPKCWYENN